MSAKGYPLYPQTKPDYALAGPVEMTPPPMIVPTVIAPPTPPSQDSARDAA
jgi:hypothetical protein